MLRTDGRTDGRVTISLRNFVGEVIIMFSYMLVSFDNTTGAAGRIGTAYYFIATEVIPCLPMMFIHVTLFLAFCVVFDRSNSICRISFGHCIVCPLMYGFRFVSSNFSAPD